MELRTFAERILLSADLAAKLAPLAEPTDREPGPAARVAVPARPETLQFQAVRLRGTPRRRGVKMPHPDSFAMPHCRAIAHHIMANHELQALEVMAWVLLAFPEAPAEFRLGLAAIMADEQRHTRMHLRRLEALGTHFGAYRVNGYVWKKTANYQCLLDYLATLPLAFENANLDHSLEFAELFADAGDAKSAAVMRAIHDDEIEHVRFGWDWLCRLKPAEEPVWQTFAQHLSPPLQPGHARGTVFQRAAREQAGLDPLFIARLEAEPKATGSDK